ncbi:MAG: hypothetical protein ACD_45C00737G0010 [uncultured bacterium]|nr:MAG: hypothetical protein ACD_45C00737G0010 [uncultured bacterium]
MLSTRKERDKKISDINTNLKLGINQLSTSFFYNNFWNRSVSDLKNKFTDFERLLNNPEREKLVPEKMSHHIDFELQTFSDDENIEIFNKLWGVIQLTLRLLLTFNVSYIDLSVAIIDYFHILQNEYSKLLESFTTRTSQYVIQNRNILSVTLQPPLSSQNLSDIYKHLFQGSRYNYYTYFSSYRNRVIKLISDSLDTISKNRKESALRSISEFMRNNPDKNDIDLIYKENDHSHIYFESSNPLLLKDYYEKFRDLVDKLLELQKTDVLNLHLGNAVEILMQNLFDNYKTISTQNRILGSVTLSTNFFNDRERELSKILYSTQDDKAKMKLLAEHIKPLSEKAEISDQSANGSRLKLVNK